MEFEIAAGVSGEDEVVVTSGGECGDGLLHGVVVDPVSCRDQEHEIECLEVPETEHLVGS